MRLRSFARQHLALATFSILVAAFLLYQLVTTFFVYTWDAYVAADVATLSAEVPGRIVAIPVRNNQQVKAGDPVFEIAPDMYRILVAKGQASLAQKKADHEAAVHRSAAAEDAVVSARAQQAYAAATHARLAQLLRDGVTTQQSFDASTRNLDADNAQLASAVATQQAAQNAVAVAKAALDQAQAELDEANYNLSRTRVVAPADGTVAPFVVKVGDYLKVGDEAISIVTDSNWRVVVNLEERYVRRIAPGHLVYVHLTTDYGRLHRGRVRSIARGVARSPQPPNAFPYVPTAVDWVRLQRRYPVEVDLEDVGPPDLFAGSDASVFLFVGIGDDP